MDIGENSSRSSLGRGRPRRTQSHVVTPQIDHDTAHENRRRRKAQLDENRRRWRARVGGTTTTESVAIRSAQPSISAQPVPNEPHTAVPSNTHNIIEQLPNSGASNSQNGPATSSSNRTSNHRRTIFTALNLGGPTFSCTHCGAFFWYEERVRRHRNTPNPTYNLCCRGGRIRLPPYQAPPQPLLNLLTSHNNPLSRHFFQHIRQYNSMFAMTSMEAKVIDSINDGHGPYIFKISGQVCHRVGSLIPSEGSRPEYAQLYIFDTENEVSNRINVASSSRTPFHANEDIVRSLIQMLDTNNPIVKLFRTARERLSENSYDQYSIRLFGDVDAHGDIYSFPVASEVVGLVVGDIGHTDVGRDLIIEDHSSRLQQIDERHRKFMAMQYPILFPYGEDGFHDALMYNQASSSTSIRRQKATMAEYFAYRLHDRPSEFNTPLRCGRGTQAYEVDAYCCVEKERIDHYRTPSFQRKYRSATYNTLASNVSSGIRSGSSAGQRIILPASFTGSPRYLYQKYQDCIGICRKYGCPDLFVTFTSNSAWPEIAEALPQGLHPSDRPDIVDRVFEIKLNILMDDIKKRNFFGPINAGLAELLPKVATEDRTVILTSVNEVWTRPNSLLDIFLGGFRDGEDTAHLVDRVLIVTVDAAALRGCKAVHPHCYLLEVKSMDMNRAKTFGTPEYVEMMWLKLSIQQRVLELGYNFLFTDADILWLRNPFQHISVYADMSCSLDNSKMAPALLDCESNVGFYYMKSTNRSVAMVKYWRAARARFDGNPIEQVVFNRIKHELITELGARIQPLETEYISGYCDFQERLDKVCTVHANCCMGLENKVNDLRNVAADWRNYTSLTPEERKKVDIKVTAPSKCRKSMGWT